MNIRKEPTNSAPIPKRLLSVEEASGYLGLGKSAAKIYLEKIGAKRKIGRRVLYDKTVIDTALNAAAEVEQDNG